MNILAQTIFTKPESKRLAVEYLTSQPYSIPSPVMLTVVDALNYIPQGLLMTGDVRRYTIEYLHHYLETAKNTIMPNQEYIVNKVRNLLKQLGRRDV